MEVTEYVTVEWIYIKRVRDRWSVVINISGSWGYINGEEVLDRTTYY
jgi:hypothetical protein